MCVSAHQRCGPRKGISRSGIAPSWQIPKPWKCHKCGLILHDRALPNGWWQSGTRTFCRKCKQKQRGWKNDR